MLDISNYKEKKLKLNAKQKEVFDKVLKGGKLLASSVPGSGKTLTATISIAGLILEKKVKPTEIFMSTFTKKAATEMKERLENLITKDIADYVNVYTFHSFCYQMLKRFGASIYPEIKNIEIIDEDAQGFLFKKVLNDTLVNLVNAEKITERLASDAILNNKKILGIINNNKNLNISLRDYAENNKENNICTIEGLTVHIWSAYEYEKKEKNLLDFNDIMVLMNALLKDERFSSIIKNFTKYIIVDEFQDTNQLQMDIIDKIEQGNLYVFGDDAQSIYAFRGSDINIITGFEKKYNADVINMDINYRSHKVITDAATELIFNNKTNIKKTISPYNKFENYICKIIETNNEYDEAENIANMIESRKELDLGNEIAVIYRNNNIADNIANELKKRNILYDRKEEYNIFNRVEIKLLFTFISAYKKDEESIKKIFLEQKGIGKKTIEKIEEECKENNKTFLENALLNKSKNVERIATMLNSFINNQEINDIDKFLDYLVENLNLQTIGNAKMRNIQYVFSTMFKEFNTIKEIELSILTKIKDNAIKLITCHTSKGLEFDTVFAPSFNQEIIPSIQAIQGINNEIEEERRLAYVTFTRAKRNLIITYYKFNIGRNKEAYKSQFLDEFNTLPFGVDNGININNSINRTSIINNVNRIIKDEISI